MPPPVRDHALESIDALAPASGSAEALAEQERTPEFAFVRALAMRGVLLRLRRAGPRRATGAWAEIDFAPPAAQRLRKDWSWLGVA